VHWSRKSNVPEEVSDESDVSTDVEEDEEGADLTPALDAAILRTLGKIRRGEGVYEGENVLETELEQAKAEALRRGVKAPTSRPWEAKPYLLSDHHRAALLEGRVDEEAEEEENRWRPIPYAQEQRRLRKEAIEAFHADDEEDEGEFVPVKKDQEEVEKEDDGYRQFLLEMGGGEEEVRRLLGMGDQAVSFVRADEDEASGEEQVEGEKKVKKESEKKRQKRMQNKAKADDEFLMK
jgi:protein KRI1